MKVELYVAPPLYGQRFHREREVPAPRPSFPRLFGEYDLTDRTESDRFIIGRHRGIGTSDSLHLPWTAAIDVDVEDEDLQLSRDQIEVVRSGMSWDVAIPIGTPGKRSAIVQYWASNRQEILKAGGRSIAIRPGDRLGAVVRTDRSFYWAMFANSNIDVPGSGRNRDRGMTPSRSTTLPQTQLRLPRGSFPYGWEDAVRVKFEPYLSWPMGWHPRPLPPSLYRQPPASFTLDLRDDERARKQYENQVKKRLFDLKAVAMEVGYTAPDGIEAGLLDWLRENRLIEFGTHRCDWRVYDE